jgi:hypothetical protein
MLMARFLHYLDLGQRGAFGLALYLSASSISLANAAEPAPKDPPVRLRLSGYVQADAVVYRQSSVDEINPATGEPLNENRFTITRGRLRADATSSILSGALELDANTVDGPAARIFEAEVSARWAGPNPQAPPYVMATLGLMRIPFGADGPYQERSRLFLERATATRALFPGNYDLGVRLSGGYRPFRYALAIMNGEPVGQVFFPARDANDAKDILGRIGVDTSPHAKLVEGGFSALSGIGLHRGTPSTKDVLVWRDANENGLVEGTEMQVIPGTAATPSQNFARFALGADVRLTAKWLSFGATCLFGEIVRAQNLDRGVLLADPIGAGRDLRQFGYQVGFTQEIGRFVVLGARYDRYNPDDDASEQQGKNIVPKDNTYSSLAVAAAFRYTPSTWTLGNESPFSALRIIVEYDFRSNALGRTAGGLPTTLGDDSFAIRGEVSF